MLLSVSPQFLPFCAWLNPQQVQHDNCQQYILAGFTQDHHASNLGVACA